MKKRESHLSMSCGVCLLVTVAAVSHVSLAHAGQQCPPSTVVTGVDLNADGDTLNWASAAGDGVKFAIVKATQGNYYTDDNFASSWAALKADGVVRGAYHFLDPTVSGVTQAEYFLNAMGPLGPNDLPPTLDAECPTSNDEADSDGCLYPGFSGDATGAQITQAINDWVTTVMAATGRKPMIYTYIDWIPSVGVTTTGLDAFPLWIAADANSAGCFTVPAPWTTAAIWQYSDGVTYSGIGSQDGDRFLGTLAQLTAFTQQTVDGGTVPVADSGAPDSSAPSGPFAPPAQPNGNDALSIVNWADGHMEVYATGSGTGYRVDTELGAAPADTWKAAVALGGAASCGIASAYWAPGSGHTSEVFDGLANGTTESLEYVTSSSSWTSFSTFGGVGLSHLSTVAYPDSHLEVFALGDDGVIWHNVSTQSSWGGWATLGTITAGFATGAAPILWNDGHAQIFATDTHGGAWENATSTAKPPVWGGWKAMSGPPLATRPIPARWADGHVQVFARGTDDHLYMSNASGGVFPAFTALNPTQSLAGEPSVLVYPDYGPEIFARDGMNNLIHMWNATPSEGGATSSWSTWANDFGEVIASDPLAWTRPDGLGEVFAIDGSGRLVKSLHGGADWGAFATLATGLDACLGGTALIDAGVPVASPDSGFLVMDAGIKAQGGDAAGPVTHPVGDASTVSPDGGPDVASRAPGCSCRTGGQGAPTGLPAGFAGVALGFLVAVRRQKRDGKD